MKYATITKFTLAPGNAPALDGTGLQDEVKVTTTPLRYDDTGALVFEVPNSLGATTPCINLSHGVSEWWTAINRYLRANPEARLLTIAEDYAVAFIHTRQH